MPLKKQGKKSKKLKSLQKKANYLQVLTESDLKGFTFTKDDYRKAFADVSVLYDKEAVRRRDEQLRDFVNKLNSGKIGFNLAKDNRNQTIF